MTEKPSVLGLLEAWEARYPLMEENARKETDEQTARYYAARATELRDCASQLRHLLNTLSSPEVIFAERAEYRDPEKEVTLVGRVFPDGVRIGCQALEPWYGTGVLIPPTHPAYMPAQRFLAALSATEAPE